MNVLLFVVPPIAGFLIGYLTNVLAIKMLFRPLKEIRLLGIRLPFTPGILPRQRKKLAVNIGEMVERELLTAEVLRKRLENVDLENFAHIVCAFLRREDIRLELESKGRMFLRNAMFKLNTVQRLVLSAGQYDQTLEDKMPQIIDDLVCNLENLLKQEDIRKKLMGAVDNQVENILSSIDVKTLVSDRIDSLDMLRVERIILDVLSNQLKWVEIFGGIIGFFIGIFQAGLTYLLR
ncbi:MAG: DUF445 family protein [Treponema sp.]|nr:DUF445 family protein [Treponema sp.]MCL2236661.1 DUF445 family protein [Treponema sp.]